MTPLAPPPTTTYALEVDDLTVVHKVRGAGWRRPSRLVAADHVTFRIEPGTTFGLVGESGSGKTTVARAVLGLVPQATGTVRVAGHDIRPGRVPPEARRDMQAIFQNPAASLNPARRVIESICEPLRVHMGLDRAGREEAADLLCAQVHLGPQVIRRLPHELSGGQCQRAAIARSLAPSPRLIVCDEPITALDVSTQAKVINLLVDLQDQLGVALLLVSHNISIVRHVSKAIGVMYMGRLVEIGDAEAVADSPSHPYTQSLLDAVPVPDPIAQRQRRSRRRAVSAEKPVVADIATDVLGCPYHRRCPLASDICSLEKPELLPRGDDGRLVACHHA